VDRDAEEEPSPEKRRDDRIDPDRRDRDGDRREDENERRRRRIAPPALVAVVDQIPITAAPSAAYRSDGACPVARNMRNASVA
jgi:hypothetical protein